MEQAAQENLERQGFVVFLPLYKKQNKRGLVFLPLFPGYLFTSFDPAVDRWQRIHSTMGVARILGYSAAGNTLAPVKQSAILSLQAHCDEQGIIDMDRAFPSSTPSFSQGDRVKILSGMFKDHYATYWNSSKDSSMIILSLLNRPVRVILRSEEIIHSFNEIQE